MLVPVVCVCAPWQPGVLRQHAHTTLYRMLDLGNFDHTEAALRHTDIPHLWLQVCRTNPAEKGEAP